MKRLNPQTNEPFKRGDYREDGFRFLSYLYKDKKRNGFYLEQWISPKKYENNIKKSKSASIAYHYKMRGDVVFKSKGMLHAARTRCRKNGGEVTITWEWLAEKIKNGRCELTGLPFDLLPPTTTGKNPFAPSIDRINPRNKNYELGNVRVILQSLNMALSDYGIEHLMFITDAMKLKLN